MSILLIPEEAIESAYRYNTCRCPMRVAQLPGNICSPFLQWASTKTHQNSSIQPNNYTWVQSIILAYLDQRFEHEDVLLRNRPPRADGHLAHPPDQLVQAPRGWIDQLGFQQYVPICAHRFLQNARKFEVQLP
jgi:hypothetical protein